MWAHINKFFKENEREVTKISNLAGSVVSSAQAIISPLISPAKAGSNPTSVHLNSFEELNNDAHQNTEEEVEISKIKSNYQEQDNVSHVSTGPCIKGKIYIQNQHLFSENEDDTIWEDCADNESSSEENNSSGADDHQEQDHQHQEYQDYEEEEEDQVADDLSDEDVSSAKEEYSCQQSDHQQEYDDESFVGCTDDCYGTDIYEEEPRISMYNPYLVHKMEALGLDEDDFNFYECSSNFNNVAQQQEAKQKNEAQKKHRKRNKKNNKSNNNQNTLEVYSNPPKQPPPPTSTNTTTAAVPAPQRGSNLSTPSLVAELGDQLITTPPPRNRKARRQEKATALHNTPEQGSVVSNTDSRDKRSIDNGQHAEVALECRPNLLYSSDLDCSRQNIPSPQDTNKNMPSETKTPLTKLKTTVRNEIPRQTNPFLMESNFPWQRKQQGGVDKDL